MFRSRIGFQFSEHEGESFHTFYCAENKPNEERFFSASSDDVNRACDLASLAFLTYKSTSDTLRAKFLADIALGLEKNRNRLIEQYRKESSLSEVRGNAELDRTIFQLNMFSELAKTDSWRNRAHSSTNSLNIESHCEGIGPVAVFGSSNFPFAYSTIGGDAASALCVGCPVIVKAHPMHAGTSCLVAEIILEIAQNLNLPNGVFSHLLDGEHHIGQALVQHPEIKAVGFTGSIKGGRFLMDLVSKRKDPIPIFAEMGSINPVVFLPNELSEKLGEWVERFSLSISTDAGQFCTKPGLLFVPRSEVGREFAKKLSQRLEGLDPIPQLHPSIFDTFQGQVEAVFGAQKNNRAFHSQPCLQIVDSNVFRKDGRLQEEFFGPQAILVFYDTQNELDSNLKLLNGQLTATIIATKEEFDSNFDLLEKLKLKAGRIIYNGVPTGVTVCDAMVHGGAFPASSDVRFTAVGIQSVSRFVRPIAFQTSIQ